MILTELSASLRNPWRALKGFASTILQTIFRKGSSKAWIDESTTRDDKARRRRVKGLEKFILALSDQQLITGLGIFIAAYHMRCSMSFYHFKIVSTLAWFSSTTHLSTLSVLRVYLIQHPRLRNWRVTGMVCMLVMLILAQTVSASNKDLSLPIQCVLASPSRDSDRAADKLGTYYSLSLIIGYLLVVYINRVVRLYSYDPDFSVLHWMGEWCGRQLGKRSSIRTLPMIILKASRDSQIEAGEVCRSMKERNRIAKLASMLYRKRRRSLYLMAWIYAEVGHAFLGQILTLTFGLTYGVAEVITVRNVVPTQGLAQDQNTMEFGQVLPLLLITLPFLQVGEIYYGKPTL